MYKIFLLLLFISFKTIYSQTDTMFIGLKGFEDSVGTTQLLLETKQTTFNTDVDSTIFTYNVYDVVNKKNSLIAKGKESLYFPENHSQYRRIADIEFINNDPQKFIYAVNSLGIDPDGRINRYDQDDVMGILGHFSDIYISSKDQNRIYAIAGNWIIQSSNAGLTWDDFSIEIQRDPYIQFLTFSPFADSVIFGCDSDQYLYKSNDTGKTFNKISDQRIWNNGTKLIFDLDQTHIYALISSTNQYRYTKIYNNLYVSENFGDDDNWENIYSSYNNINICLDDSISGEVYLVEDNEVKKSTDYGQTFNPYIELENIIRGIYKSPDGSFFVSLPNKLIEYQNNSQNILKQFSNANALEYYPLHIGDIWQYEVAEFGDYTDTAYSIAYRKVVGDTIMSNKLIYFKILDETKRRINNIEYIRVDSSNGSIYLYHPSESEELLDNILLDIGDEHPRFSRTFLDSIYQKNVLGMQLITKRYSPYVVISSGTLSSFEYSKSIGLSYKSIYEIDVVGTTYRYQLKYAKINGIEYGDSTVVSVKDDSENQIATQFSLSQNYPNPFNPTTTIKYTIPPNIVSSLLAVKASFSLSNTKLIVYDILGRVVETLVDRPQNPGNYEVTFDAKNLASGIYYYQLLVNDNFSKSKQNLVKTKKMLILK